MYLTAVLFVGTLAAIVAAYAIYRKRQLVPEIPVINPDPPTLPPPVDSTNALATYSTETIESLRGEWLKLAFGVTRFDYQIFGEHLEVLERIDDAIETSAQQREYFPRRPMLLPKLLQSLNDTDTTRRELVQLILQDPSLAGAVLQRANSAFYRIGRERVDSLDRAVGLLGVDGLRGLLATAIMQPVFRLQKGHFDQFAPLSWEQAQYAAAAAEKYAALERSVDPFVAQLLAVLEPLARIVIFRLTLDKYRESPNVLPRPEVFIRAIQAHSEAVAVRIAATWELSDDALEVLQLQAKHAAPNEMTQLAQSVYYSRLTAELLSLVSRSVCPEEVALDVLTDQGLSAARANALFRAPQIAKG
jgi:HD-like signal output (HDOD) protein